MRRIILTAAAAALALAAYATNAEASRWHHGNGNDASHVSIDELRLRLGAQGYTDVVYRDNNRRDPWVKVHATDPAGQRVFILLDNTGNIIRVTPLDRSQVAGQ